MTLPLHGYAAFNRLWTALSRTVRATPDLAGFARWPQNARFSPRPPAPVPATRQLAGWTEGTAPETAELHHGARMVAPLAEWRLAYSEADAGAHMLANYGFFELAGTRGHFLAEGVRAYLAYWGPGLHYDWHLHEAEEIYYVVSGQALFEAAGEAPAMLGPGQTRAHAANQPHAMTTTDQPLLAVILWRGEGMNGSPRMGRA